MPYTHAVEGKVVHISWHGVVSKEDLRTLGEEMPRIVEAIGFVPDLLHTFERMERYSFQPISVYMFSLLRKRVQISRPSRSALVATTPETKSLARIFKMVNRTPNLEMAIFGSESAARRWLARE